MEQKLCPGCEEPEIEKVPACPLQCRTAQCKAYQKKSKFDPDTKPIVWVLGGPGCGKFTQCKKIMDLYGFTHISTGDIIRDEVASGSARAKCLTSIMNRGGLVPNDLVLDVLKKAMEKAADAGARGFLVDGYPREKSQGAEFEKAVGHVSLILYFEASVDTLCQRLLTRAQTSDRQDDKEEVMKLRIATFLKHNQSVIQPYGSKVVKINAEQAPDAIFEEVKRAMEPMIQRAAHIEAQRKAEALKKEAALAEKKAAATAKDKLPKKKIAGSPEEKSPGSPGSDKKLSGSPGTDKTLPGSPGIGEKLPASPGTDKILPGSPGMETKLPGTPGIEKTLPGSPGLEKKLPGSPGTEKALPGSPGLEKKLPGSPGTEKALPGSPGLEKKLPGSPGTEKALPGSPGLEKKLPGTPGTEKALPGSPKPDKSKQ